MNCHNYPQPQWKNGSHSWAPKKGWKESRGDDQLQQLASGLFLHDFIDSQNNSILFIQVFLSYFVCSEADKVPVEGLSIKDKDEEKEKHGNGSSGIIASSANQSAAFTQWVCFVAYFIGG